MDIEILKTGNWAFGGLHVREVRAGEVKDYGSYENDQLIQSGWAKPYAPKEEAASVKQEAPAVVAEAELPAEEPAATVVPAAAKTAPWAPATTAKKK